MSVLAVSSPRIRVPDIGKKVNFKAKYDWLHLLSQTETVALDTESFGLERQFLDGSGYNMGFSLCVKLHGEYFYEYIPVGHRRGDVLNWDVSEFLPVLQAVATKRVFMYNAPYDKRVIATHGVFLTDYIDLVRLTHLDDENYPGKRSLENMVKKYVGPDYGKEMDPLAQNIIALLGWGMLSYREICDYGAHDAYITYLLAEATVVSLGKKKEADKVFNYWRGVEQENYEALYNMKSRGILVDLEVCDRYIRQGEIVLRDIEKDLGFNPGSGKDLERVLIHDLGLPVIMAKRKGKPDSQTFNKDAMERYELILEARSDKRDKELARKILEYRGWSKALSSYYRKYVELVYPDGRVRPSYLSHGTKTGRFACVEPNLQQLPKEIDENNPKPWVDTLKKDVFYGRSEHELWEFDYAQLEFRLGAHFSEESVLLEAFNEDGRDVFTEMAALLSMPRQGCKTLTYSINYGAGIQRIMDAFDVGPDKAKEYIQNFYSAYPALRRRNMATGNLAKRDGKVKLWTGRYRHFQYEGESFKAFNSFIQGGAADLVKLAMNRINRELPEVRMLLQVHDSLIFELPVARRNEYKNQIMEIMGNPLPNKEWLVKLKTDAHMLGAAK